MPVASDELAVPPLGTLCFAPPILNPVDPRLLLFSDSFFSPDPLALFPVVAGEPSSKVTWPSLSGFGIWMAWPGKYLL